MTAPVHRDGSDKKDDIGEELRTDTPAGLVPAQGIVDTEAVNQKEVGQKGIQVVFIELAGSTEAGFIQVLLDQHVKQPQQQRKQMDRIQPAQAQRHVFTKAHAAADLLTVRIGHDKAGQYKEQINKQITVRNDGYGSFRETERRVIEHDHNGRKPS